MTQNVWSPVFTSHPPSKPSKPSRLPRCASMNCCSKPGFTRKRTVLNAVMVPLLAVRRIDRVELPDQRRPLEDAELAAHARLVQVRGLLDDLAGRQRQLGVAGERRDLELTGALEAEDIVPGLRDASADDEQPVVAQDHRLAIAEVAHQALLLVELDRDALVVVIADVDE